MPALPATPAPPPTASARGAGQAPPQPGVGAEADESPFSALLGGANAPADASVSAPMRPGTGAEAGADGADSEPGTERDEALPDHLLGLLGGSWLTPAAPSQTSAAAAPGVSRLPGAHAPGLAMPTLHTGADAPPLPASASLAMAIQHAASGADAALVTEGEALATALAQALPQSAMPPQGAAQAATASATFETLIRDAAGPAATDAGGVEPAPLTATTGTSTTSLSAVRASPLAQPLPMPADPSAGFDDGLSTRVAWMAEQGIGRAELRVNPDHAGPIEVRLQMEGTRLVAEFSAANADTRQALEAGMHRLRDMLGQQGLQLAQSHVGGGGGGQGRQGDAGGGTAGGPGHADGGDIAAGDVAPARWVSRGLLDEYA